MAVAITRAEPDAAGLRHAAARTKDADTARRMLALALVLDGRSRAEAAQSCGMDRRARMAKPHEFQAAGYDRRWTGSLAQVGKGAWAGELGDYYGGRLKIDGKAQGASTISLRAAVHLT